MIAKMEKMGKLLICQGDSSMRKVFELLLGDHYELVFADSSEQVIPLLRCEAIRLLIWDIDPSDGSLEKTFKAISTDSPLENFNQTDCLEALKAIRQSFPDLMVLLIAGEFDVDFQVEAIQKIGLVRFIAQPWKSSEYFTEQVQAMLGDRESSIHHRILRVPIAPSGDA